MTPGFPPPSKVPPRLGLPPIELIVMRLGEMRLHHPLQDNSRRCDECEAPVGIFPSGQRVIAIHPEAKLICNICCGADTMCLSATPAPGALEEIGQGKPK